MHQGIRAVTFNIQHGVVAGGGRVDNAALARSCAALDADVLAVQEIDVGVDRSGVVDQVALVSEATGLLGTFEATVEIGSGRYGHALFARGAVTVVDHVSLETRGAEPRAALVADVLLVEEQRLRVVSTHLSVDRQTAMAQLETVLDLCDPGGGPCLFLGDCNLPRWAVRRAARARRMRVPSSRPTYPAAWPYRWIDHIVVGGGLTAGRAEVRRYPVSDHRSLAATVLPGSLR